MSVAEKITRAKADLDNVYEAGYEKGKAEGVGGIDYDKFWDNFQGGNGRVSYVYAFAYDRFDDETYNPKYPIVCSSGSTTSRHMFYSNTQITDTKVPIDTTGTTDLSYIFYKSGLVTIRSLKVKSTTTYSDAFTSCSALKNITFTDDSVIGNNVSFSPCPLTRESIESVYRALSTTVTGKTVTFKQTAVNAAFTTEEWNAMTAAKSNWSYTLA